MWAEHGRGSQPPRVVARCELTIREGGNAQRGEVLDICTAS